MKRMNSVDLDDAEERYFEDSSDQDNDDYEEVEGILADPDYEWE